SDGRKIVPIELDEYELLALELAQTDFVPCRAGEREVRGGLPDLQGCALHTHQHASQHHTSQHHMADGWCSSLHGLSPLHDRTLPSYHAGIPGQHGTTHALTSTACCLSG